MLKNKFVLLVLSLLLLFTYFPEKIDMVYANSTKVVITTETLNVREGPGLSYKVISVAKKGDNFTLLSEKDDWLEISLNSSGKKGWVASWLVKKQSELSEATSTVKSGIVTANNLRVRSGPGTSYEVVSNLGQGVTVSIVKTEGNWYQIKSSNSSGWVSAEFIQVVKAAETGTSTNTSQTGTVTVNSLNVRSTASTSGKIIGKLQKGNSVSILGVEDKWMKIQFQGQVAWVSKEFIQLNSTSEKGQAENASSNASEGLVGTITATTLNVRSTNTLNGKIIGSVSKGQEFRILSEENNWAKIQLKDGKQGWVAGWYLSKKQSSTPANVEVKDNSTLTILFNGTNIRKSATTSSSVVSRVNAGSVFDILSVKDDWYEIKLSDGTKGFVAGWLVAANGASQQIEKPGAEQYLRNKVIVIDPGHGGRDQGATGIKGTAEKTLTLKTAQLLYEKLKTAGAHVVMTRNNDTYLSLSSRVGLSHTYAADAFISIHFDSILDSSVRGMTTYYYHNYQQSLASEIHKEVANQTKLKNRGVRFGDYHVLRENKRASVLLELGYLSNSAEEMLVSSQSYQVNAAAGIYQGLARYFKQ